MIRNADSMASDAGDSKVKYRLSFFRHRWYPLTAFVLIFILSFGLYQYSQRKTTFLIYWLDDWVFYADTRSSYSHMKDISFEGQMRKHPLYTVVLHPLVEGMKSAFRLKTRQAAKLVIALQAALNVSLFFVLLHVCIKEKLTVFLFVALYGILFSNLVFFSIPETYSLANVGIVSFFLLTVIFNNKLTMGRMLGLGAVAGVGALLNPPLGLLLFCVYVMCVLQLDIRKALQFCMWASIAAVVIYLGTNFLLFGIDYLEYSRKTVNRWAAVSNYLDAKNWLNVIISFLVYGVISPLEELKRSIALKNIGGYFRSPLTASVFLAFVLFCGYAFFRIIWRPKDRLILAAAVWLAVLSVFYVYFNPAEAFLYSCQAMAPFMLILARTYGSIAWKWKALPLGVFIVGMTYINFDCLRG